MGKKRVGYDCNEEDKPPTHVVIDHHHHHHHHRHHNHQKAKKIKPEDKLLHTLNSHFKKLAKTRSRIAATTPPPPPPPPAATLSHENGKRRRGHQFHKDHLNGWFMSFDSDHEDVCHDDGDDHTGVFKFGQELCWKTLLSENNDDLFGGDCVFSPDLNAGRKMVVVFEEDGFGFGSYIPDQIMKSDYGDEGSCLYDILELSSQEDMINEFFKVNLFVPD